MFGSSFVGIFRGKDYHLIQNENLKKKWNKIHTLRLILIEISTIAHVTPHLTCSKYLLTMLQDHTLAFIFKNIT